MRFISIINKNEFLNKSIIALAILAAKRFINISSYIHEWYRKKNTVEILKSSILAKTFRFCIY